MGTAWARHAMCESAFILRVLRLASRNHATNAPYSDPFSDQRRRVTSADGCALQESTRTTIQLVTPIHVCSSCLHKVTFSGIYFVEHRTKSEVSSALSVGRLQLSQHSTADRRHGGRRCCTTHKRYCFCNHFISSNQSH